MAQGLYVHIPFCASICTYCDFPKTVAPASVHDEYVTRLVRELESFRPQLAAVETIYLGGGTPSHLSGPALDRLFAGIAAVVDPKRIREATIEANPSDVTPEFIARIRAGGIDRISLGVQSGAPGLLRLMGRTHTRADVERAVATLRAMRFHNINLDFIYALPGETMAELEDDLAFAVALRPTHLSFYTLILEPRTILWHEEQEGRLSRLDEETEARMFERVTAALPVQGYPRYEVSNFAIPGFESKHNLLYWNAREYVGVGMGAHSQYAGRRFHNHPTLKNYLAAVDTTGFGGAIEDPCDLIQEASLMGLRKAEGIDRAEVWSRFQVDVVRRYPRLLENVAEGLVTIDERSVRLTDRGLLLLNYVERSLA